MIDYHVHTDMSYCAEKGLSPDFYAEKLQVLKEPAQVYITDHSMAIYFPEEIAWKWEFISDNAIFEQWKDFGNKRLEEHLSKIRSLSSENVFPGIETEMTLDGHLCFDEFYRKDFGVIIGSVHFLPENDKSSVLHFWLTHTLELINRGIDILGHPFRWIAARTTLEEKTIREVALEAAKNNVALELNSHYKHPEYDIKMIELAAEYGAKISIASDSHKKEQFGDYSYHLNIIERAKIRFNEMEFKKNQNSKSFRGFDEKEENKVIL